MESEIQREPAKRGRGRLKGEGGNPIKMPVLVPKRTIDGDVVKILVEAIAVGADESEACLSMGIKPSAWVTFKQRRKENEEFQELLKTARAMRIQTCIAKIEQYGDERKDWRAWDRLLQIADARFKDKPSTAVQVNVTNNNPFQGLDVEAALKRVYGAKEPKQLAETTEGQS